MKFIIKIHNKQGSYNNNNKSKTPSFIRPGKLMLKVRLAIRRPGRREIWLHAFENRLVPNMK